MVKSLRQRPPSPLEILPTCRSRLCKAALLAVFGIVFTASAWARAQNVEEAETLLRTGRYDECAKQADQAIAKGLWSERWYTLRIKVERTLGKDEAAVATLEDALQRFPESVPLHLLARDVYQSLGRDDGVKTAMDTIERLVEVAPQRYAHAVG